MERTGEQVGRNPDWSWAETEQESRVLGWLWAKRWAAADMRGMQRSSLCVGRMGKRSRVECGVWVSMFLVYVVETPFGNPLCVCLVASVMCNSLQPCSFVDCKLARFLCPWDSPGKNIGVGCHFLLQGTFLTQGPNPGLLHCRQILYHLSYQGSPLTGPR